MKCVVCNNNSVSNTICCSEYKTTLMAKLDNIQSLLESSIPTDVFFAYSLILEEEFAKQLTKLHGNELCGSAHFRTIRQLFDFMVVKHQQYCTSDEEKASKILRNGQISILRREKEYTVTGQEVK